MLKYKKPTIWVSALCVLLIAVTAVCFLTNPVSAAETDEPTTPPNGQETTGTGTGESTTTPDIIMDPINPAFIPPGGLLSKELELEISEAYQKKHGHTWVYSYAERKLESGNLMAYTNYYGIYGDCVVLYKMAIICVEGEIEVGEYCFQDSTPPIIEVYRDGDICYLEEAYNKGWITDEQLRDIWVYHYYRLGMEVQ